MVNDNLTDFLTDLADAIREKTGTNDLINPQDFAAEIASIEGGGGGDDSAIVDGILGNTATSIKSNATSLRAYALRGASKLVSVDLPKVKSVGDNALYGVGLSELYLPACTSVGGTAICYCNSLVKVDLPSCTSLGTYAFRDNKLLASVSLNSLKTLSQNALYNCGSLKKISLPNVTTINASAFNGSASFETIILGASSVATLANTNAFTGTKIASGSGYIYVPSALVDSYKAASNWSSFASQIRAIEDYPDIMAEV